MKDFPYIPYCSKFSAFYLFIAIAVSRGLGRLLEEDEALGEEFLLRVVSKIENNRLGTEDIDLFEQLSNGAYTPQAFALLKSFSERPAGEIGLFRGISGFWKSKERQFWNSFLSEYFVYYEDKNSPTVFSLFLSLQDKFPLKKLVKVLSEFISFLFSKTDNLSTLTVSEISKEFIDFLTGADTVEEALSEAFFSELYRGKIEISELSVFTVHRWEDVFFQEYPVHLIVYEPKGLYDMLSKFGIKKEDSKDKNAEKEREEIITFPGPALASHIAEAVMLLFERHQIIKFLSKSDIKRIAKIQRKIKEKKLTVFSNKFFASYLFLKEKNKIYTIGLKLSKKELNVLKTLLKKLVKKHNWFRYQSFLERSLGLKGNEVEQMWERIELKKLPPPEAQEMVQRGTA